jgi:hypothetical protein
MAEQDNRPSQTVVWQQFNQTPLNPQSGENPITRVINMVLGPDKAVRTRSGFSRINTGTAEKFLKYPDASITTHLVNSNQDSTLILVGSETLKEGNVGSFSYFNEQSEQILPLTTHPTGLNYYSPQANEPGYFSAYGGEIYYCQSTGEYDTLFAWDGSTKFRNIGVAPMVGDYTGQMKIKSGNDLGIITGDPDTGPCGIYIDCCEIDDNGNIINCYRDPDPYAQIGEETGVLYCCEGKDGEPSGACAIFCNTSITCDSNASICSSRGCADDNNLCRVYQCMPQFGFAASFCWHVPDVSEDNRGEKILNFAFKIGYYDQIRGTFGRAAEPRAAIFFGPNRDEYSLYQYQLMIDASDLDVGTVPDYYSLAIWSTIGQEILTVKTPHPNLPFLLHAERHAMSPHFNDTMYLETIVEREGSGGVVVDPPVVNQESCPQCGDDEDTGNYICLFKDQTALVDSGQYMQQYDRPVPSKGMVVLPGGTALYLFPRRVKKISAGGSHDSGWAGATCEDLDVSTHRPGVEFSIGHPEQIGRNTNKQNETFASLPALRGTPMHAVNDGGATILLTRQTMYQMGFQGGQPTIQELGGPGCINHKSVHHNSNGLMFVADEGPIWMKGGRAVEILRELKFDGWIDPLTDDEKKKVRIGMIEDGKKILMSFPVTGTSNEPRYRVLMHDVTNSFTSEWWIGDDQPTTTADMLIDPGSKDEITFMVSHKGDSGYKYMIFLDRSSDFTLKYDQTVLAETTKSDPENKEVTVPASYDVPSLVEMWVNQLPHLDKQAGVLTVDFGHRRGVVTVRVSSFESPQDRTGSKTGTVESPLEERTATIKILDPNLVVLPTFMGMRGKYFRVRIETVSDMSIKRATLDVNYDMAPQIRMSPIVAAPGNPR